MATWRVTKTKQQTWSVDYFSMASPPHHCGELRLDTSERMIVEWVVGQVAARPRDLIILGSGARVAILPGEGKA